MAFKEQGKGQLMRLMRTVWVDTSGTGRLMLVLAFKADAHGMV